MSIKLRFLNLYMSPVPKKLQFEKSAICATLFESPSKINLFFHVNSHCLFVCMCIDRSNREIESTFEK